MMQRIWVYARTASNCNEAIAKQMEELLQYAASNRLQVVGMTGECTNGLTLQRTGIIELLQAAKAGKMDAVLVKDFSRLTRHSTELSELFNQLKKCSVSIHSVLEQEQELLLDLPTTETYRMLFAKKQMSL